jgi:hypothetical protein
VANLRHVLYYLPKHVVDYLDPLDGYQGPLSGQYESQEFLDASQDAQHTYDVAKPQNMSLAHGKYMHLINRSYNIQEWLYSYGSTLHDSLNNYNNPYDTYSTAKPHDVSLTNGEYTHLINRPYNIQKCFYGYTDQGNMLQSPHSDECEPQEHLDMPYNASDVIHLQDMPEVQGNTPYPKTHPPTPVATPMVTAVPQTTPLTTMATQTMPIT